MHDSHYFGFESEKSDSHILPSLNWKVMKQNRDDYVKRLNGIYKGGPKAKHGAQTRIGKLIKKNEKMGIFRLNYNGQDFVLPLNSLVTATATEKRKDKLNHKKGTASDTPPSYFLIEKMRTQTPSEYYKPIKPLS